MSENQIFKDPFDDTHDWSDALDKCMKEYTGIPMILPTSYRGTEWAQFAEMVRIHVEDYTVPQYGDAPNDQAEGFTPDECVKQIQRYCNRFGKGQRGMQEQLRDMKKIAHYACLIYMKLQGG